jgi:molybdopterin adenylyltransferase
LEVRIVAVLRTGILHIPEMDDESTSVVMATLRGANANPVLLLEATAHSQRNWIADILCRWCDEEELDLLFTIGGTLPAPGPGGKEIVPEATSDVVERDLPGLAEAMRAYALEESALALLERGRTGIRGRTLIVNLPGGAASAGLFLEAIADIVVPLCAHLHEDTVAPTIRDAFAPSAGEDASKSEADADAGREDSAAHGLNQSDFAEFLQRPKQQRPAEGEDDDVGDE